MYCCTICKQRLDLASVADVQTGLQTTQKVANDSLKKDDNNAKWELKQQVVLC